MKQISDMASAGEQAVLEALEQKTKKRERRGKILLVICLVIGFLTAGVLLIGSVLIGVLQQSKVTDITEVPLAIPGTILAVLLAVACYMLAKGFSGARIVYAICMGVVALCILYLLLEDTYTLLHYTPEMALLYLLLLGICLAAAIIMPASPAIKEVLYDREVRSRQDL